MSSIDYLRYMVKDEMTPYESVYGVDVVKEMFESFGRQIEMKKIALQTLYSVPWVMNNQSSRCMRCDSKFGLIKWKHHCRGCGYLVCHGCSSFKTRVTGINEGAGSRVCKTCHHSKATIMKKHSLSVVGKSSREDDAPSPQSLTSASTEVDVYDHTDLESAFTCE